MVQKSSFRNEHVEAYLAGRFEEIPQEAFEAVKMVASLQTAVSELAIKEEPDLFDSPVVKSSFDILGKK
jgi:hypothetical protein